MNLGRYYHTLRYLRLHQIVGRAWFRLYRPRPDRRPALPLRARTGSSWVAVQTRQPMMLSPTRFRFLNEEHEVKAAADWNDPSRKDLWRYNLHYFEDLVARDADERRDWHRDLIQRWVAENPPGKGIGWDPYPLSLRICNWIKWTLSGNELPAVALHSLAIQTRYLRKRHDNHLLGNHLLVNAKAFIFAGLFFEGPEADRWLRQGLRILQTQIPEQILADGGHFERSPMYHNLIVEDFLDILNLLRIYGREDYFRWHDELTRMRRWAGSMSHPDGQIALFNDAAFGIASTARELEEYALRIGLPRIADQSGEIAPRSVIHLQPSGYVRAVRGPAVLIADVAPLGPDYLPGHGHADTLSFELSLQGQRLIVDTGTSIYEICAERLRQRGTAAHNAVVLNGRDSSEVWASFRVARRARIGETKVTASEEGVANDVVSITAAHDGYRRVCGGWHRRIWKLSAAGLEISDEIEGRGVHRIDVNFHFHPDWELTKADECTIELAALKFSSFRVRLQMSEKLDISIAESTYHPEFGLSVPNRKVVASCRSELPLRLRSLLIWRTL